MHPRKAELDALLDRLLARGPRDFERVMPIDARQQKLTERFIVPALPQLEAEFLAIRADLDADMRRRLEANPAQAIKGDPSRYPKGYCLPITIGSLSPRSTAPNQIFTRSPRITEPMIVASSAM